MRHRTTEDQALTFNQIFCEVYPDVVEKYSRKDAEFAGGKKSQFQVFDGDIIHIIMLQSDYEDYYKIHYLKRMIKQIRKTDDEFRWLSVLSPIKVYKTYSSGYRARPYVEYRYLNIKASKTPELLSKVNAYWFKRDTAVVQGLRRNKPESKRCH
jgi:hypothetical protein